MLVLSRKVGQSVRINDNIIVTVVKAGPKVRLSFNAPKDIPVLREEVWKRYRDENRHDTTP